MFNKSLFICAHQIGHPRFYPTYKRAIKNQWKTHDELKQDQEKSLRNMIRFAYKNVPFYHKLFNNLKLSPEDIKKLDDFRDKTFPFTFDQKSVTQLEIKKKGSAESVNHLSASVGALISGLQLLKVQEFFSPQKSKVSTDSQIVLKGSQGETVFSLTIGSEQKSSDNVEVYLVKTNLSDEVLGVAKSSIDDLLNKKLEQEKPK